MLLRLNDPEYIFVKIYVYTFLAYYHLFGLKVVLVHKYMTSLTHKDSRS